MMTLGQLVPELLAISCSVQGKLLSGTAQTRQCVHCQTFRQKYSQTAQQEVPLHITVCRLNIHPGHNQNVDQPWMSIETQTSGSTFGSEATHPLISSSPQHGCWTTPHPCQWLQGPQDLLLVGSSHCSKSLVSSPAGSELPGLPGPACPTWVGLGRRPDRTCQPGHILLPCRCATPGSHATSTAWTSLGSPRLCPGSGRLG